MSCSDVTKELYDVNYDVLVPTACVSCSFGGDVNPIEKGEVLVPTACVSCSENIFYADNDHAEF